MVKKRLAVLICLIMTLCMLSYNVMASEAIMPHKIHIHELPYTTTTADALKIVVNLDDTTEAGDTIFFVIVGGYFNKINKPDSCHDYPYYNEEEKEKYTYYADYGKQIMALTLKKKCDKVIFPVYCTITSKNNRISAEGEEGKLNFTYLYNFAEYSQVTTPPSVTTTQNAISITPSTSNTYSSSSGDSVFDKIARGEITVTPYLSKSELTGRKITFLDVINGTAEFDVIDRLAEKGVISQNDDQAEFNMSKQLSTADSCTYLSKLLVANDSAKAKLDDVTVKKYLDPKDDSFAYLATVGSMLSENTLKVVSDSKEMSRELLAQVLMEVTNIKADQRELPFTDVDNGKYKEAIEYCYNAGLLVGTSETTMSPSDTITNGQMLHVLDRLDQALTKKDK